jgi:hypothetical protein
MIMVRIETNEGLLLDVEDSKRHVEFMVQELFENLSDFLNCEDIRLSNYWGDVHLFGTEEDYYNWITQIAEKILKT